MDPDALRVARERAGLSQSELATRLNVSRFAVIRWEAGDATPRAGVFPRLHAVLGVDLTGDPRVPAMLRTRRAKGWDARAAAAAAGVPLSTWSRAERGLRVTTEAWAKIQAVVNDH